VSWAGRCKIPRRDVFRILQFDAVTVAPAELLSGSAHGLAALDARRGDSPNLNPTPANWPHSPGWVWRRRAVNWPWTIGNSRIWSRRILERSLGQTSEPIAEPISRLPGQIAGRRKQWDNPFRANILSKHQPHFAIQQDDLFFASADGDMKVALEHSSPP